MARTGATAHVHKLAGKAARASGSRVRSRIGQAAARGHISTSRPSARPSRHVARRRGVPPARQRSCESVLGQLHRAHPRAARGRPVPADVRVRHPAGDLSARAQRSAGTARQCLRVPARRVVDDPGRAKKIAHAFQEVGTALAARSALAASLGCADPQPSVPGPSELTDAVRIASAGNSSLRPVIDLLAGLLHLDRTRCGADRRRLHGPPAGGRGAPLARRRRAAAGFPRPGGASRPAARQLVGAAAGFAIAVELVRLFTPDGSVDGSVVRQAGSPGGALGRAVRRSRSPSGRRSRAAGSAPDALPGMRSRASRGRRS